MARSLDAVAWIVLLCGVVWLGAWPAAPAGAQPLELTPEEQAFIRDHPVITYSDVRWEPLSILNHGRSTGVFHDYYQLLAARTGLAFKFVQLGDGLDFQRVLTALRAKEIDLIDGTGKTQDRAGYALFAGPFFHFPLAIASREDVMAADVASLHGRRVVVASGSTASEYLREHHPDLPLTVVEDPATALRLVATHQADAMLDNLAVVAHAIRAAGLANVKISGQADYTFDIYSLVRNDMPLLQSILEKAHQSVSAQEKSEILSRWLPMYPAGLGGERREGAASPGSPGVVLADWERDYLQSKGVVRYCIDPDWMPVERINEQGVHEGMTADLLEHMAQRLGVRFELTPSASWPQSLELARTRRCDILVAAGDSPRRRDFLSFTSTYLRFPLVVAARSETPFVEDARSLHGQPVGVLQDNISATLLRRAHGELDLVELPSIAEGLAAVADGRLYGFVDGLPIVSYAIGKENLPNLKIAGRLNENIALALAVRNDDPLLLAIMQKAVNSLTQTEIDAAFQKWVAVKFEHGIDYTLLWRISLGALALIGLVVAWNRKLSGLNRAIGQAHQELAQAHARLGALLDHSGQGFLSFGRDLLVQPQYSRECRMLLCEEQVSPGASPGACVLEGRPIHQLLHPDSPDTAATLARNLERILATDDDFKREMLLSLLPGHCQLRGRRLRLQYRQQTPGVLMLILTDETHVEQLRQEVQAERDRLSLVVGAVRETAVVRELLAELAAFLNDLPQAMADSARREALRRQVHTLKGQFAQFDFIHLPKALHALETHLTQPPTASAGAPPVAASFDVARLAEAAARDEAIIRDALGDVLQRGACGTEGRPAAVAALAARLLRQAPPALLDLLDDRDRDLLHELETLGRTSFRALLGRTPQYAVRLAARQGKEIHPILLAGGEDQVPAIRFAPLAKSLVHVFRNAVVHGLETPEERVRAGKDEAGTISFSSEVQDGLLLLRIADDGRGLDAEALRRQAVACGLLSAEAARTLPHDEALALALRQGCSTSREVTELSGRGLGLAAVLAEVQALGGEMTVHSQPGQGAEFSFRIPLTSPESSSSLPSLP